MVRHLRRLQSRVDLTYGWRVRPPFGWLLYGRIQRPRRAQLCRRDRDIRTPPRRLRRGRCPSSLGRPRHQRLLLPHALQLFPLLRHNPLQFGLLSRLQLLQLALLLHVKPILAVFLNPQQVDLQPVHPSLTPTPQQISHPRSSFLSKMQVLRTCMGTHCTLQKRWRLHHHSL